MNPIYALLRSRKFLLAIFGLIQALTMHYLSIPEEVWQATTALILAVIAGIAIEDGAEKWGRDASEN
jgi:hypothetical protein